MTDKINFGMKRLLLLCFALSGMTALIYEVVWARPLQLIFGSTICAVSTMLTTFFVGFALGSYLFRNIADKVQKPINLFAMLEIGIGLYGFIILWLFKVFLSLYANMEIIPGHHYIRMLLIFLILIIPTTLFGATWPVVNRAYVSYDRLGKDAGKLYSFNSVGSAIGALACGFILLPLMGVSTTGMLVAVLNIVIGFAIIIYVKYSGVKHGA